MELKKTKRMVSKETREKMHLAAMGNKNSLGFRHSEASKRKMSEARKGKMPKYTFKKGIIFSEKHKRNLSLAARGKRKSEKHCLNLGLAHKGQVAWNKRKQHFAIRKEKHWNWQGGITPINKVIRHSLEYKLWREAVFKRDGYTCVWCGIRSAKDIKVFLHPDHIKPFAYYPELRFAIDNGRTLCESCHKKTDTYAGRAKKFFSNTETRTSDTEQG